MRESLGRARPFHGHSEFGTGPLGISRVRGRTLYAKPAAEPESHVLRKRSAFLLAGDAHPGGLFFAFGRNDTLLPFERREPAPRHFKWVTASETRLAE